jgi:hypothetical protein
MALTGETKIERSYRLYRIKAGSVPRQEIAIDARCAVNASTSERPRHRSRLRSG